MPAQKDLIHEISTTTGTGSFSTSAVNGKVRFSDAAPDGFGTGGTNVFDYYISSRDAAEWEHGTGHMSAVGTLVRDTVVRGSNGASLVSFTAGTKDVTCDVPASDQLRLSNYLSEMSDTAAHQMRARSSICAAPFDALAYNGMQVNGGCEIDQPNVGNALASINGDAIDGWQVLKSGSMVLSAQQVPDAPPGYSKSLKVSVTTAQASLGSTDYAIVRVLIETTRTMRLAYGTASAQPVSLGFWVKAHRTGTYSGSIQNNGADRAYSFSFTVNSADTWEWKAVSLSGDTSGTWPTDTSGRFRFVFAVGAGSSMVQAPGAWGAAAGNVFGATGTTNGVAATSDTFQITGFVFLPGLELPSQSRAPLIMRPFDQELLLCQRYFQKSYNYGTLPGTNLGGAWDTATSEIFQGQGATTGSGPAIGGMTMLAPRMRAAPTLTLYDSSGNVGKVTSYNAGGTATNNLNPDRTGTTEDHVYVILFSGSGAYSLSYAYKADARL